MIQELIFLMKDKKSGSSFQATALYYFMNEKTIYLKISGLVPFMISSQGLDLGCALDETIFPECYRQAYNEAFFSLESFFPDQSILRMVHLNKDLN